MTTQGVPAGVRRETEQRLRRLARIAEVLIDGEVFKGIVADPAVAGGDDYRVDDEKFIVVKKFLLKLKRIEKGDVSAQTWRPFANKDGVPCAVVVVPVDPHPRDVKGIHPLSAALKKAFDGGTGVEVLTFNNAPLLSVCAPIRDSLGDIVGVVEVFGSLAPRKYKVDRLRY